METEANGLRKAAILMIALGDEYSGEVFKYLSEQEIRQIVQEISTIESVNSQQAGSILNEFHKMVEAHEYVMQGGSDYARKVLEKAFGQENGRNILGQIVQAIDSPQALSTLQKADPRQLSRVIQNEHPQTIALILAHLPSNAAVALLMSLPEEVRVEVIVRMATLEDISQDILHRISTVLDEKLKTIGTDNREAIGGTRAVAEIFNRMDREEARVILEKIGTEDSELAMSIRNNMVVFEDLMMVDDSSIKELLSRADRKLLATALKGASPELRQRFYSTMSAKAAELLREEMDFLGAIRVRDATAAQKEIMEVARTLEDEGVLSFGGGMQDEYIS